MSQDTDFILRAADVLASVKTKNKRNAQVKLKGWNHILKVRLNSKHSLTLKNLSFFHNWFYYIFFWDILLNLRRHKIKKYIQFHINGYLENASGYSLA